MIEVVVVATVVTFNGTVVVVLFKGTVVTFVDVVVVVAEAVVVLLEFCEKHTFGKIKSKPIKSGKIFPRVDFILN
jgi:hypothetical protein